jgi:hypothetical protein
MWLTVILVLIIIIVYQYLIDGYLTNRQKRFLEISFKYENKYPILKKINNKLIYNGYRSWALKRFKHFKRTKCLELSEIENRELKLYSLFGLWYAVKTYKRKEICDFKDYAKDIIVNELHYGLKCIK